jgi:hypothetical protein
LLLAVYLRKKNPMARPNLELVEALRQAAKALRSGAHYAWGSHGSCNCGHLLQVVTKLSKEEIIRHAQTVHGEWTEIADDYCGITNAPAYLLVSKLEGLGLTPTDIHNLEYLEDRKVLERLPGGFRWLKKNVRDDVIIYFETFAEMLEERLINAVSLPEIDTWLKENPKTGTPYGEQNIQTFDFTKA